MTHSQKKLDDDDAMFDRLRALAAQCRRGGCNTYDTVNAMIPACIAEGIAAGPRITAVLQHLGFNRRFVGMTLTGEAGTGPGRHRWYRGDDGLYLVHDTTT